MKKRLFCLMLTVVMSFTFITPVFAIAEESQIDNLISVEQIAEDALAAVQKSNAYPDGPDGYTYAGVSVDYGTARISSEWISGTSVALGVMVSLTGFGGAIGGILIPIGYTMAMEIFASTDIGDTVGGYTMVYKYTCDNPAPHPYIYYYIYHDYLIGENGDSYYVNSRSAYDYALMPD